MRFAIAAALFLCAAAPADTITFTFQGVGSGILNGVPFSPSSFTITAVGETANRSTFNLPAVGYFIDHSVPATIDVDGVGVLTIATPTRTFVSNANRAAGFGRATIDGPDLYNTVRNVPAFANWDMLSSIGPIICDANLLQWTGHGPPIMTNAGVLAFDNAPVTNAVFTAVVPASSTSTLLAMAAPLLARRRRRGGPGATREQPATAAMRCAWT